jgi:hypothetical protein
MKAILKEAGLVGTEDRATSVYGDGYLAFRAPLPSFLTKADGSAIGRSESANHLYSLKFCHHTFRLMATTPIPSSPSPYAVRTFRFGLQSDSVHASALTNPASSLSLV